MGLLTEKTSTAIAANGVLKMSACAAYPCRQNLQSAKVSATVCAALCYGEVRSAAMGREVILRGRSRMHVELAIRLFQKHLTTA
jgi:hypothetical protein